MELLKLQKFNDHNFQIKSFFCETIAKFVSLLIVLTAVRYLLGKKILVMLARNAKIFTINTPIDCRVYTLNRWILYALKVILTRRKAQLFNINVFLLSEVKYSRLKVPVL